MQTATNTTQHKIFGLFQSPFKRTFQRGSAGAIEKFKAAIAASGLTPPEEIIANGQIQRFSSNGNPKDTAGWYVLYADGNAAGAFGCWRNDVSETWSMKSPDYMTDDERRAHAGRMEQARQSRLEEMKRVNADAAATAQRIWDEAMPVKTHPYLTKKGVKPHGLRSAKGKLLVPMYDADGELVSIQTIDADGVKRFMKGGKVTGSFFQLGEVIKEVVICEGFATGATIHEVTGLPVVVAFSAGNLPVVSMTMHDCYPKARITVAADNDRKTPSNPGVKKATEAAAAVGGRIAVPRFPVNDDEGTDFNDLCTMSGPESVIECIESAAFVSADGEVWAKPRSVIGERPPVMKMRDELLPESLRAWVNDISFRMSVLPDFPAVSVVVALSSLIGARAVMAPKAFDSWTVVPVLFGALVAISGSKKSPAMDECLEPLYKMDEADYAAWEIDNAKWQTEMALQKLAADDKSKSAKEFAVSNPEKARQILSAGGSSAKEPKRRRRVLNDATVSKLGEILVDHPYGLMMTRDELTGLLSEMDEPGKEGLRGFFLTAYDGKQSYTFDRTVRGTVHVPRVCLSILGGIQPGVLDKYVRECLNDGAGNDGLLQRFSLAVWPDAPPPYEYPDQAPDEVAKAMAHSVYERLNQLKPGHDGKPLVWRYTAGAQQIFREWLIDLEEELQTDLPPALLSHFSKYRKLVPALSLIFALVDTPNSGGYVHEREVIRAIEWWRYLRTHAIRIYTPDASPGNKKAATLLDNLRKLRANGHSKGPITITPREVALKGWSGLSSSADARKALDILVDHGWMKPMVVSSADEKGRGRPSQRYLLHPDLTSSNSVAPKAVPSSGAKFRM